MKRKDCDAEEYNYNHVAQRIYERYGWANLSKEDYAVLNVIAKHAPVVAYEKAAKDQTVRRVIWEGLDMLVTVDESCGRITTVLPLNSAEMGKAGVA